CRHFASLFFVDGTQTTEIYTLSLHDALPIYGDASVDTGENDTIKDLIKDMSMPSGYSTNCSGDGGCVVQFSHWLQNTDHFKDAEDRKSTRLNSSHVKISYAVFCLKKKNNNSY